MKTLQARRLIPVLLAAALVGGCAAERAWVAADPAALGVPEAQREFRGVWVATVANIDWPSAPGLNPAARRAEAERILDLAARLNLNAVILQVRPHADALYMSRLEPWTSYLTGVQGGDPGEDPLRAWIDGAHDRGLELHAWINPFRATHPADPSPLARNHIAARRPDLVRRHGDYGWLDPSSPEAADHTARVVEDLVRRYDLDGVHIDDYFYPYPIEGSEFDDLKAYEAYRAGGGVLDRSAWRRSAIDAMVRRLAAIVAEHRPAARFGISPFGIWRPGHPEGVTGFDAYEGLAADARLWLRAGWVDYLAPQLYWPIESAGQPFVELLRWWSGQNPRGRGLWPGLYLTRIKAADGWAPDEIIGQIGAIRAEGAGGFILFSAVGLVENRQGVADRLLAGPLARPALPPVSWRGGNARVPRLASLGVHARPGGAAVGRWTQEGDAGARAWLVQFRTADGWLTRVLPGAARSVEIEGTGPLGTADAVAVTPIDGAWRLGRTHARARALPSADPAE
jgi:uncharacterized lipoprotein YddW (UPF0748 family)